MPLLSTDGVCFRRDANGDLLFPLQLARGLEAVAIGARARLLLFAGEWFLNLLAGVKWLASADRLLIPESAAILGEHYDEVKAKAEFRRELLTTPGVVDVPMLVTSFDSDARRLGVTWIARTLFGDTPVDSLARTF